MAKARVAGSSEPRPLLATPTLKAPESNDRRHAKTGCNPALKFVVVPLKFRRWFLFLPSSRQGLAVGGIAISLRVPPVVRSGALGVGVASRGRSSERPATRAGWSPAAGD